MPPAPITISAAVEGPTDEAVLRRVLEHLGASLGPVYGKHGKPALLEHLSGYNHAAQHGPWIVLVDLDQAADCAPPARAQSLPAPSPPHQCVRLAGRKVESWLLADREALAAFLRVTIAHIPSQPEALPDPKDAMVNLARRSRRRDIRLDMVPRPESGRSEGPAYTSRLIEYAQSGWRPEVAAQHAESLQRLCRRVTAYMKEANG
ncbi:MAG: hypothetical protein V1772_00760 [Chloroflexota bacterium]